MYVHHLIKHCCVSYAEHCHTKCNNKALITATICRAIIEGNYTIPTRLSSLSVWATLLSEALGTWLSISLNQSKSRGLFIHWLNWQRLCAKGGGREKPLSQRLHGGRFPFDMPVSMQEWLPFSKHQASKRQASFQEWLAKYGRQQCLFPFPIVVCVPPYSHINIELVYLTCLLKSLFIDGKYHAILMLSR